MDRCLLRLGVLYDAASNQMAKGWREHCKHYVLLNTKLTEKLESTKVKSHGEFVMIDEPVNSIESHNIVKKETLAALSRPIGNPNSYPMTPLKFSEYPIVRNFGNQNNQPRENTRVLAMIFHRIYPTLMV